MSYRLIKETERTARVPHRCIWCGESIAAGDKYLHERSVFDGEMQNHHWHHECMTAMHDAARYEGGEIQWSPGSEERPIKEEALEAFYVASP